MKTTAVEAFRVEVPITEAQRQLRCQHSAWITRVATDEGLTGYGFGKVDAAAVAALLAGRDPHAIERHLDDGLGRTTPPRTPCGTASARPPACRCTSCSAATARPCPST